MIVVIHSMYKDSLGEPPIDLSMILVDILFLAVLFKTLNPKPEGLCKDYCPFAHGFYDNFAGK